MSAILTESNSEEIIRRLNDPLIHKYNKRLFRFYSAGKIINDYLDSIEENKNIVIWGGGEHTAFLFLLLSYQNKKKIKLIVDNDILEDEYGIGKRYELPQILKREKADVIMVSAFASRYEILEDIRGNAYTDTVFDMYVEMEKAGFDIGVPFHDGVDYSYENISLLLLDEKKKGSTESVIKTLISELCHIKDFVGAITYIDKLKMTKCANKEDYLVLKEFIQNKLDNIRDINENKEHIVINLIDALRYDEVENVPYLEDLKKHALVFENMYTMTPYTSATLKTVFSGKMYLDDGIYNTSTFDFLKNSPFFLMIKEYGYDFSYYGIKAQDSILQNKKTKVFFCHTKATRDVPSTIYQFLALVEMEASEKGVFFIHNLAETHSPYMNGIMENQKNMIEYDIYRLYSSKADANELKEAEVQIINSQRYIGEQLEFYGRCYGNRSKRIYFSDHGQFRGEKPICVEGYAHVLFFAVGCDIKPGVNKNITSLKSFINILCFMIEGRYRKVLEYDDGVAFLQTDDLYNNGVMDLYNANNYSYRDIYIQHRGVVTPKDIYLVKVTGEEFYFLKGCDKNLIEDTQYRKRIAQLKELAGNGFINIYKTEKYKYTRKFYDALGLKVKSDAQFLDNKKYYQKTGEGLLYWITGLSGAGKTTIGTNLYYELRKNDKNVIFLDGDIMKPLLEENVGYSNQEREKRAWKYANLCRLLTNQGFTVVCCTIAMFESVRNWNRNNNRHYIEVFLDVPIDELKRRDQKGLYSGVKKKNVKNVVGYDMKGELPQNPDLIIANDGRYRVEECVRQILSVRPKSSNSYNRDTGYWNAVYSNTDSIIPIEPSLFARSVIDLLYAGRDMLELGCGNGRDGVFFASRGMCYTGIDASHTACLEAKKRLELIEKKASIICDDFVNNPLLLAKQFDYIYSRFTIHAINALQENELIDNTYRALKPGGLFLVETRSINDDLYGKGKIVERNAFFYNGHYRRFIVMEELKNKLIERGFKIVKAEESQGFAPFGDKDPLIIRIIAKK